MAGEIQTSTEYYTNSSPPPPLLSRVVFTDERDLYHQLSISSGQPYDVVIGPTFFHLVPVYGFTLAGQPLAGPIHLGNEYVQVGPYRFGLIR